MNPVYLRVLLYAIAIPASLIPGVVHDPSANTLTIDLEAVAMTIPAAVATIAAIFAKWGKK